MTTPVRRLSPILLAWLAGLSLALAVYVIGPDRFLFRLMDTFHVLAWRLSETLADLLALDAIRALAIGLFATFLALGIAVLRRGGRARGALIFVSVLFLLLAGGGLDDEAAGGGRWAAALLLAAVGAVVMTGRLRHTGAVALR